ncbi:MAG: hypothetical protein HXS52_01920 [Theionarchaea archaeon]|nr:hypothetical protein [Theionarchaea archaeon]MBU7036661.1 hypothetical protein [Theionarchaea archaeon]
MKMNMLAAAVSIVFLIFPAQTGNEIAITSDLYYQKDPALYEETIVWADNRNGNWDIFGYDLSTGEEFQITSDLSDQESPCIYGDLVVWLDKRNNNKDIYGYNIKTKKEFQITTDVQDQRNPALGQTFVVWEDSRSGTWNIYAYNLSTGKELEVAAGPHDQYYPVTFDSYIVWCERRNKSGIYACDLATTREFCITENSDISGYPVIDGDDIFWAGSSNLYSYNLETQKKSEIPSFRSRKYSLTVHGDTLVWLEYSNTGGGQEICGQDLKTNEELRIATGLDWESSPAVYGDLVVWMEAKEDESSDIHGRYISTVPAAPLPLILKMPFFFDCLYGGMLMAALIGSFFAVKKWSLRDSLSPGKGRDFKRGSYASAVVLVCAASYACLGFHDFCHYRDYSWFISLLPYTISLLAFFWYRETPSVRVTEEKVILFSFFYPQIIAWDEVLDTKFLPWKSRIELVLDDKTVGVDLDIVEPEQKRDLITVLSRRSPGAST